MRKIRNQALYKVINTITKEVKSEGSTKEDAKKQLRLLRGLEKKEGGAVWRGAIDPEFYKEYMKKKAELAEASGGALKADQIKDVIDLSYTKGKDKAPKGYVIDKDLSDDRVKVYKDLNSNQVIVAHRGSSGWRDWLDNARYLFKGDMKNTGTYKEHKKKHDRALDKYGADNVIAVGHSRAGKYVEELNKDRGVKEVITYNKAAGLHDVLQKNPKNQTDIRTSRDLVSMLNPFQRNSNKIVTIDQKTLNPLKAHGTDALEKMGEKLIGQGFTGGRFNPKKLRVGDMRKFIKAFKKHQGEKWTGGAKITKKDLCELVKPILMEGGSWWKDFGRGFVKGFTGVLDIAKVPLGFVSPGAAAGIGALSSGVKRLAGAGMDYDEELMGGSVWTDFVKEFSAKHGLKYACALSKYKEPLKKAYKLKKENKEWYEPFFKDSSVGTGENITFTIEEKTGSGVMSGGNKWTDFVKDYAGKYKTTYGCALSDMNIKGAYKLFKDGKEWYIPKSMEMSTGTEDFIEPTPEPAPVDIEPVVNRIEERVKELEDLGRKKGAVSYDASTLLANVAFVNMMKKYGGKCLVANIMKTRGVDVGIDVNNNPNNSDIRFPVHIDRLGEALLDCINRGVTLILIPLTLKFGSSKTGHANMLVYRPFKRIVERFEPHGTAYGNSMVDNKSFNDQLKKLWETDLKKYLGDVRFKTPDEICPNPRGFQSLEGSLKGLASEGGGFCSMWSIFLAEMTFVNPAKSTKEIIEEVFDITAKDPAYLKSLIRGYVVEVEKGLDELLKTLANKSFSFAGKGLNSPYMKTAGSVGELDTWLLSTIFDTKKYSAAPPGYEPLPDVVLKDKSDQEKLKETYFNKMRSVKIAEIENIYSIYGRKPNKEKRDDMLNRLLDNYIKGDLVKYGSKDISDLDRILDEELHKKKGAFASGLARTGYFTGTATPSKKPVVIPDEE
jgi:hypothetical protein